MNHRPSPSGSLHRSGSRRLFLGTGCACVAGTLVTLGCERTREPEAAPPTTPSLSTSLIPLRVWVAAPIADQQIWLRQWLAHSEQPLELRSFSTAELLQQPQNDCDVLLYPARLIGELTERGWIIKLPETVQAENGAEAEEQSNSSVPAAWRQQAIYAGQTMAIPLGCALPVFITSDSGPTAQQPLSWEEALEALQIEEQAAPQLDFDAGEVDREALVDRFLAIVATLSSRDPSYGLLFDLQTMQSRLTEDNFVRAAKILAGLATQPLGVDSVIGSHSAAWQWAATTDRPAMAIAAPALLDPEMAQITTGQIVRFRSATAVGQRPKVVAWNSGGGLLVSLSNQCRQSSHAAALLRWLAEPNSRTVLSKFAMGIEASAPTSGVDSLAWRARQSLADVMSGVGVAQEPRLPLASLYRSTLADELIAFLSGKKGVQQSVQAAHQGWGQITAKAGQVQRRNYEQSLGLTL